MLLLWALALPAFGQGEPPKVLVLGDSLSAAYGIPMQQGWVTLLQKRLAAKGYPHKVINASISGDTTRGGLSRLAPALKTYKPAVVLIELGANDGLRGQPADKMAQNLTQMIELCRSVDARPVLFEMRIPPNYGPEYVKNFFKTFGAVAKATKTPLVPFFLGAFANDPKSFQDDGIHPTAAVQAQMLDAAWPVIEKQLGPRK